MQHAMERSVSIRQISRAEGVNPLIPAPQKHSGAVRIDHEKQELELEVVVEGKDGFRNCISRKRNVRFHFLHRASSPYTPRPEITPPAATHGEHVSCPPRCTRQEKCATL